MDRLIAWLEAAHASDDGLVSLVHGDYRLDNMIFATDDRRFWPCSTGNCRRSAIPMPTSPINACNGGCRMIRLFAVLAASTATRWACLRKRTMSRDIASDASIAGIADWTFHLAFSFFRLAAICQGVYKRALDGNASNPEKARSYGEAVTLLAGLAVG